MNDLRVLVASDLHGGNAVFRKLVGTALQMRVDVVLVPGDLSGKDCFFLWRSARAWEYSEGGDVLGQVADAELEGMRQRWHDSGIYSVIVEDPNGLTGEAVASFISVAKAKRMKRWIGYLEERVASQGIQVFMTPGNDDSQEIVDELQASRGIIDVDGTLEAFGGLSFAGLGYSNRTPWNTFRELEEAEILTRLESLVARAPEKLGTIFLIHVPPYGTGLDLAPSLKRGESELLESQGGIQGEVGSIAVRQFVERHQPLLVASGHCHDSAGYAWIGRTLCVNPGSAYASGTLYSILVTINDSRVRGFQMLVR